MEPYVTEAIDFALTNGLIKYNPQFKLTHAPFCLSPHAIQPRMLEFLVASTPVFNELMIKVGSDRELLEETLGPVARTDRFIGSLLDIYRKTEISHHLQISRNDFLLSINGSQAGEPKQVEFNTISNSFLYLTQKMYQLHKYMENHMCCRGTLSENNTLNDSVAMMAEIVRYYDVEDACVLMVVQHAEQNLFDQRGIEYKLRQEYGIVTIRKTLEEIAESASIRDGHLWIDGRVMALTYFRAGYTPADYAAEKAWEGRVVIENSSTVKCPSVGMQLAGAKKVQQVLARPRMLERYLSESQASDLSRTFAGMYDLDESVEGQLAGELAIRNPDRYVLKPQREGGGNNLYDQEMVKAIQSMSMDEQKAYVLMERIMTPQEQSVLVVDHVSEEASTVSEIGRYGVCFFDGQSIKINKDSGYLVRTKAADQNEGGVCAGYACLNSLCVEAP